MGKQRRSLAGRLRGEGLGLLHWVMSFSIQQEPPEGDSGCTPPPLSGLPLLKPGPSHHYYCQGLQGQSWLSGLPSCLPACASCACFPAA